MKQLLAIFLSLSSFVASAQITTGLTGIPDTSFNNPGAYKKELKYHPGISLVTTTTMPAVKQDTGIVYCTTGTRQLLLDVFAPKGKSRKQRPAILIIHGGGWRSGNRTQHHPLAQQLASRGYVCFTPEYRLSTEALYPAAVHDLQAAIRYIRTQGRQYGIDTNQLAVLGFSAGGQLAALLGVTGNHPAFEGNGCHTKTGTEVQAILDLDGTLSFVHPESGEGDDSKGISAATYWFGYPKKENAALWEAASPLTYVGPHTPPTLFLNSSVDRMHAGRDDYMKILRQYGIRTEVYTFEGAPHTFPLFEPWFHQVVEQVHAFLQKVF
ncbi:alpha/beta hydrolase [Paraflavitalea pollutisoli]|uniref:alpha/beta hydrolase n=1 Tax=Paraflavitalea pollutisoli TaxID=3034143 RepID=UPI0023EAAC4D|nr:alpha/beta hydrolase [Paraflavitalea sp. H1-2-19X]